MIYVYDATNIKFDCVSIYVCDDVKRVGVVTNVFLVDLDVMLGNQLIRSHVFELGKTKYLLTATFSQLLLFISP